MKRVIEDQLFWREDIPEEGVPAKGGIYVRAFDLRKFLDKVNETEAAVVGLRFEGNNLEVIIDASQETKEYLETAEIAKSNSDEWSKGGMDDFIKSLDKDEERTCSLDDDECEACGS